jgi:hypothetical protein
LASARGVVVAQDGELPFQHSLPRYTFGCQYREMGMLGEGEPGSWQGRCFGNLGRMSAREWEEVRVVVAEKCSLGENAQERRW